jgi:hypothetical protein
MQAVGTPARRDGASNPGWTALKQAWLVPAVLAAAIFFAPVPAQAGEDEFTTAVQRYREGRTSEAFGRFTKLANEGDADAARITLFLLRYGPTLYGSHWDAPTEDVEYWNNLASSSLGRATPVFRPLDYTPRNLAALKQRSRPSQAVAQLRETQGKRHVQQ